MRQAQLFSVGSVRTLRKQNRDFPARGNPGPVASNQSEDDQNFMPIFAVKARSS